MFRRKAVARTIALASVAVAATGMLVGCSTGGGGSEEVSEITLLGAGATLQPTADAFEKETGIKVNLVELPYDGLYDRVQAELNAGQVSFDVALLDAIWLPALAPGLTPLDDLYTDDVKNDLFAGLIDEPTIDGHQVGLAAFTNSEVLFYRTDLFEDPAEQAAFSAKYGYDLAAPTTWEQFRDVAEFFTRDTDGDGQIDLYGTDVKGAVETEWLATVSQTGEPTMVVDAASGDVTIANANHLEALDYYTSLLPFAPAGAAQLDWAGAQNLFYQGQTAMTRFWAHAWAVPEDAAVYGNVGVAPMIGGPGGVAGVAGAWYYAIPAASPKQAAALEFVKFAFEHNDMLIDTIGLAARKSVLEKFGVEPAHANLAAIQETLASPFSVPRPATPKWQEIVNTVLTPMLQKAVEPGADNQALLDEAKAEIEAMLK